MCHIQRGMSNVIASQQQINILHICTFTGGLCQFHNSHRKHTIEHRYAIYESVDWMTALSVLRCCLVVSISRYGSSCGNILL
jgi:hypothetical protein